jgi:hypothetical protein
LAVEKNNCLLAVERTVIRKKKEKKEGKPNEHIF